MRRLGELNVVVAHDLDPVAPWIAEVEKAPGQYADTSLLERRTHRLLVVDDEPEVPVVVCGLGATLLKGEELIAKVDERCAVASTAQLKVEQPAVERQR